MLLSSQNEIFKADLNYIKEMQINWESFVVVRDKKNYVEIRVILMSYLFDLFFSFSFGFVSKMFSSGSFYSNNCKRERWNRRYEKAILKISFFKRFLLKEV